MGRGGPAQSEGGGQADLPLDRVRGVPLVPRHGTGVVRGPGDRGAPHRAVHRGQSGPRGEARPGRRLHERGAGDDRLRGLAALGVPHPRTEAVLRGHLLPSRAQMGNAVVPGSHRRRRRRLAEPPRRNRRRRRNPRGAVGGGRGAGPRRPRRRGGRRRRARDAGGPVRSALGRLRRGAEVPDPVAPLLPDRQGAARPGGARSPRRHARRDGGRRHLRLARRRVPPLLRRRGVARAPFREDALRQRAARAGVRRGRPRSRPRRVGGGCAGDRRLPGGGDARAGGGFPLLHRRGQRGARGSLLHLDGGAGARGPPLPARPTW